MEKNTKYIFISGGVISGLGKGITTASVARLLKSAGFKVGVVKIDMYLNVDAGTMNPLEHGEVFVTTDGVETDQDIGHYERYLNTSLGKQNYVTAGQLYQKIISQERGLDYDGKCVEAYNEVPKEIIKFLKQAGKGLDFLLVELGGTVGEYQNILFFEAARRWHKENPNGVYFLHLVYLLTPSFLGEMKTKPAQQSIIELNRLGIEPHFLVCRSKQEPDIPRVKKIALASGLDPDYIFNAPNTAPAYRVPLLLKKQNFVKRFLKRVGLKPKKSDLNDWNAIINKVDNPVKKVKIAIAGKYYVSGNFSLSDAYVSVVEAINTACWHQNLEPEIVWLDTDGLGNLAIKKQLKNVGGVIVPGGFGSRGIEGKIKVIKYVRENKIPFLGLCYGMQLAVVEYARNKVGLQGAHTTEVNKGTKYPVIHIMPEQEKKMLEKDYGGTMRLGEWPCKLEKETLAFKAYGKREIGERHRHRFEVNNDYRDQLEENGLIISGTSPDDRLVEIIELPLSKHPFFIGTQFHPEFTSRFLSPNPLFREFIKASAS